MQRGYAHPHGILIAYIFSEDLAGEKNYYSQDAARSRSVKGNYQGHRGQRSRSLCNFIGQKGKISIINDLCPKYLFYKWQAVSLVKSCL